MLLPLPCAGWLAEVRRKKNASLSLYFPEYATCVALTFHINDSYVAWLFYLISQGPKENMYQIHLSNRNNPAGFIELPEALTAHEIGASGKVEVHRGRRLIEYVTSIAMFLPLGGLWCRWRFSSAPSAFLLHGARRPVHTQLTLPSSPLFLSSRLHSFFFFFFTFQTNLHDFFISPPKPYVAERLVTSQACVSSVECPIVMPHNEQVDPVLCTVGSKLRFCVFFFFFNSPK